MFNRLEHNVVMRNEQGGLSQKANKAINYRNTALDNQAGADIEGGEDTKGFHSGAADMKICACHG